MIYEVKEIKEEVSTDLLTADHLYYYKNCQLVRELYDDRYYEGCNQNQMLYDIVDKHMYDSTVQSAVFGYAKTYAYIKNIIDSKKTKYTKFWLITLTSKPEWDEIEAKAKIDKYRETHFKKYRYVFCEEHGTESEKYHQHILVENEGRFHTGINLKPTKYYDANINIKRVVDRHNSVRDVLEYMKKENPLQGNLQFFASF